LLEEGPELLEKISRRRHVDSQRSVLLERLFPLLNDFSALSAQLFVLHSRCLLLPLFAFFHFFVVGFESAHFS